MEPHVPTLFVDIPVLVWLVTLEETTLLILMTVPVIPVKMEALARYDAYVPVTSYEIKFLPRME